MARFVPNRSIALQILRGAVLQLSLDRLARQGLEFAKDDVPVDTGELRNSLHIEKTAGGGRRVVAGTDHWFFPEFGTSSQPAQPYLRPILDKLGLRRSR